MDAVAEVKSRLSIEDVISEYVQLKRAGRNFKGLSPFTNEKTPSFIVSPEKQIWHDFSSNHGGDMFSFVMEVEGLDFKGALEMLARKAGVDLDQFKSSGPSVNTKHKTRALEALELATRFYQTQLKVNKAALEYLISKRQFSKDTILTWRLGYSPNKGAALVEFLTKKGFTTDEMQRAGLISQRGRLPRDMFRGRIMIPLCDPAGQVVGFTARQLQDESNSPKYINTPATIVYDKSRQVFGLHLAKETIRKTGFVVVVEGNLDVISPWQAGYKNVVASAGTAMTEFHLKTLKRFTGDIRLCFDADRAGVAATERIIPLAQKVEVDLSIVNLHDAKDPDELIKKDAAAWPKLVEQKLSAPDWLIERYAAEVDLSSAAGKRAFTDALLNTVRRLRDPVEQEHYLKKIAELTDTSLEAIQAKFINQPAPQQMFKRSKLQPGQLDVIAIEHQRLQDHMLAITLAVPNLRSLLSDLPDGVFSEGQRVDIAEFLKKNPDYKGGPRVPAQLQAASDYVKILSLQFEEVYNNLPADDLRDLAEQLKHRLIDRYVKLEKEKLADQMKTASDAETIDLAKKADELNKLVK